VTQTKEAPPARKAAKPQYSKNTYLHLTIPIAVQGVKGFATAEEELFKAVHAIWEAILSIEPHKTHILPWLEPIHGLGRKLSSLRQGDTFPSSRNSMEARYVPEWKLAWLSHLESLSCALYHNSVPMGAEFGTKVQRILCLFPEHLVPFVTVDCDPSVHTTHRIMYVS
jgi:hypothetical protein